MGQAELDEIRARAHKLWEDAGKPDGRIDEFWFQAEQQLKAEKAAKKTPDNL